MRSRRCLAPAPDILNVVTEEFSPISESSTSRIRRNMFRTAIANFAIPAAVFATGPILARTLGITGRGELAAASAPILLMTTIATVGVPDAISYVVARHPSLVRLAVRRGTALLAASGLVATALTIGLSGILSTHKSTIQQLIVYTSLTIVPVLIIGSYRGAAAGLHQWRLVNREKYISSIVRVGGIVVLLGVGHLTVSTAAVTTALSALIAGIAYWPLRGVGGAEPKGAAKGLPGQLARYGARAWVGSLSGVLLLRLDQSIMAPLAGTTQLGLYSTAANVSDVSLLVSNAVRDVTFTADASDPSTARLARTARVSFLVSIVGGVVIAGSLPFWFSLLFGKAFAAAEPAAVILVAASVMAVPGSIAAAGLAARGRPGLRSVALVIASLLNLVALILLVPREGATGAAYATLIGNLAAAVVAIYFTCRICDARAADFVLIRFADIGVVRFYAGALGRRIISSMVKSRSTNR